MKVFRNWTEIEPHLPSSVTVGSFDGIHLGHRQLIDRLLELARAHDLVSTVVTFEPHPKKVLGKDTVHLLTDLEEKLALLRELQVAQTLVIPFTREFARMDYRQFVRSILVERLNVREMVIGHDHHFGRNREGTFECLVALGQQWGFSVHQAGPFKVAGEVVSSSAIRRLIQQGNVEKAAQFLGRYYTLKGVVEKGDGRGRTMGFPTANIRFTQPDKLIPPAGVYAVNASVQGKTYRGMMNIGYRPTFNNNDTLTSEVHLFNFSSLIYGEEITVFFKKFIRGEKKFSGIEELKTQLEKDRKICEKI